MPPETIAIAADHAGFDLKETLKAELGARGEVPVDLEAWWRTYQDADAETRRARLLPETGPKKRRRRRRKNRVVPQADVQG